jgi:ABC-2 type transport system permease protein
MKAMILKEFRQLRRDRRTVAMMIFLPMMLLLVFGYAARFDVQGADTVVVGASAEEMAGRLPEFFTVIDTDPLGSLETAETLLRNNEADVALVTESMPPTMLIDGSELFAAQATLRYLPDGVRPEVLFNPQLETTTVMVPSLIGFIMLFVGVVITSLGVVREREQGTLEQLAVMPLRPWDVMVGKIAPYFAIALFDIILVTVVGLLLFDVPFNGSVLLFAAFILVFLFVVLGLGVAISTVSMSQGEAIQLAIMVLMPQIMLSGMIFPLGSMATAIRWIGYLLPLTWFVEGMRGIFLRGSDAGALFGPFAVLVLMAIAVSSVALFRFRQDLAPKQRQVDVELPIETSR